METRVKLDHEVSFKWLIVFALPTILPNIRKYGVCGRAEAEVSACLLLMEDANYE